MDYVEETIDKYEKYINPAQAKLFRFMGLASIEGHAEGWTPVFLNSPAYLAQHFAVFPALAATACLP